MKTLQNYIYETVEEQQIIDSICESMDEYTSLEEITNDYNKRLKGTDHWCDKEEYEQTLRKKLSSSYFMPKVKSNNAIKYLTTDEVVKDCKEYGIDTNVAKEIADYFNTVIYYELGEYRFRYVGKMPADESELKDGLDEIYKTICSTKTVNPDISKREMQTPTRNKLNNGKKDNPYYSYFKYRYSEKRTWKNTIEKLVKENPDTRINEFVDACWVATLVEFGKNYEDRGMFPNFMSKKPNRPKSEYSDVGLSSLRKHEWEAFIEHCVLLYHF